MKSLARVLSIIFLSLIPISAPAFAADAPAQKIHLDQQNGYFSAQETLTGLTAGTYEIVVTNKAGKLVGFQLQNFKTHETLAMFPLKPGESSTVSVTVTTDGVRFRCPINPTPWYDLDNIAPAE